MGLEESKQVKWRDMENSSESSDPSSSSSSADLSSDADAASSSSNSSLFQFDELMTQLPIKRGLSKYYNGKSQSYASLASVGSVEDLAKETWCCSKRIKSCKSYGNNLNRHKFGPKPTIAKRSPKRTLTHWL